MISEFQLALVATGTAAVAAVWGYNAWQSRRPGKAEDETPSLSSPESVTAEQLTRQHETEHRADKSSRQEPVILSSNKVNTVDDAALVETDTSDTSIEDAELSVGKETAVAEVDVDTLDPMIEFAVALPSSAGIPALRGAWERNSRFDHGKPIRWLGRTAHNGDWVELGTNVDIAADDVRVAIQLADRQGAITLDELKVFRHTADLIVAEFGGTPAAYGDGSLDEIAGCAQRLDELCASVDIQLAIHIIGRSGQDFPNSKLKGMLEAAGLQLANDGLFYLLNADGHRMLSVCNSGAVPFDLEQMRTGSVGDITFWLDVPRVGNGGMAFDTMVATTRQLAEALDGVLVDDRRQPLADNVITGIRAKVLELQNRMSAQEIPAGGRRALRLFA